MHQSYEGLDRPGGFSRVRLLSPLAHRDYRLLLGGMSVSLLGDGLFLVALAWQVYSLSDAPTALASVGIAMTVPTIACLLIGGAVSDRRERRRVMLAADAVRAAMLATLAVLALSGALRLLAPAGDRRRVRSGDRVLQSGQRRAGATAPAGGGAGAGKLARPADPAACAAPGGSGRGRSAGRIGGDRLGVRAGRLLVCGLDRDPDGDGAGPGEVRGPRVRGARSRGRLALRTQQRVDLGDAGQRRGRLPAVHGADRGAAPVRGQAQARRRRARPGPDLRRRRALGRWRARWRSGRPGCPGAASCSCTSPGRPRPWPWRATGWRRAYGA